MQRPPPEPAPAAPPENAEASRLREDARREKFWKLWGPYLSGRQWGTVREDYSADGDAWRAFTHDDARSRAYRWGEDGLLGFTDHWCRLCFACAFWNGKDPILKERLYGLSGPEGNHGEDVKELYFYQESTPTHSYCRSTYLYPQAEFPYARLREENAARTKDMGEFELADTGVFGGGNFFEVAAEYAKEDFNDILIQITVRNRSEEPAPLHFLPTLWFRNTWSWGATQESAAGRPVLRLAGERCVLTKHPSLEAMELWCEEAPEEWLFAENETNAEKLFSQPNSTPYPKDSFHRRVVGGDRGAVNPAKLGTKCAAWFRALVPGGGERIFRFRLRSAELPKGADFGSGFRKTLELRRRESRIFHDACAEPSLDDEQKNVVRQALSGLLFSKQFYSLVQSEWEEGDPAQPPPPAGHAGSRNRDWHHLFSQDVMLVPDNWEYPYFCAWDLAFHAVSVSRVDPFLAKEQLDLLTREWYMHPNGQFPAYEWNFGDVNPPVHAWAAWRIYRLPGRQGGGDREFLESQFHKLLLNFTWWVNRKDPDDKNLFSGGFLGLDNIGVFDRSKPLPTGGTLKQADGTAWMAFYCIQMLLMALELAQEDRIYETMASKFFHHFVRITRAMNLDGGIGLWDDAEKCYCDQLEAGGKHEPLRVRSLVGVVPLFACGLIPTDYMEKLPEFNRRTKWFLKHRPHLTSNLVALNKEGAHAPDRWLLSLAPRDRLEATLRRLFDESEFLSPFGVRSLSKHHLENPYTYWAGGAAYSVDYEPGEGRTGMFGGNSNWRGPVWMPMNYLIIEALRVYHRFYGENLLVEFPTGSGDKVTLGEAARRLSRRLTSLFLPGKNGVRPCLDGNGLPEEILGATGDGNLLFHEYFHAETGRGCGASHQTGWTALVADLLNLQARHEL